MTRMILNALTIATVTLVTCSSWASIPDPDGTFHACYPHSGGRIKIIDKAVRGCRGNETEITWNEQGPTGPSGPKGDSGDKGDKGDKGDRGPSDAFIFGPLPYADLPENVETVVGSLTLEGGQYVVLGQGEVALDSGDEISGGCNLYVNNNLVLQEAGIFVPRTTAVYAFVSFSTAVSLGGTAVVEWRCTSTQPGTHINFRQLMAIRLATLHVSP